MSKHVSLQVRISKVTRVLISGMILALLIVGCKPGSNASMTARIGYEAILPDYVYFVAKERGYFEEEGLEVEVFQFNTTIRSPVVA